MQQPIDTIFKLRKRPASELSAPGKSTTRKLFAQDDGPSSPTRSPVAVTKTEEDSSEIQKAPEDVVEESRSDEAEVSDKTPTRSPETQERLRKELKLGEFRDLERKIRQSKRYSTLKEALKKYNDSVSHLNKIDQVKKNLACSPELKRLCTYEFEVETSPSKRGVIKSRRRLFSDDSAWSPMKNPSYVSPRKLLDLGPVASPTKPSYERNKQLIIEGKDELVLPKKYVTLKEIFNGIETVLRILIDRKEMITFKRIQENVRKLTQRKVTEEHLGMIKTVYPDAYELKYELMKLPFSRDETLELTIDRSKSRCTDTCERKKIFDKLLLEKTKVHHQDFLNTLDPPLVIPLDKVHRWHPSFEYDNVPDVEPTPIPRPVLNDAPVSVKDFLEKTKKLVSGNKRMENAVSQLIEKNNTSSKVDENVETKTEVKSAPSTSTNPIPALQRALKGVPQSVLEKIRAKKAARMVETITQSPEKAKEQIMLSRLPELAKIMRLVFVKEGKKVLPENVVVPKVSHSFKEKMPTADLMEHLKLISSKCPGWMSFFTVHNVPYVRLEKDADMTRIVGKLQKLAQPT